MSTYSVSAMCMNKFQQVQHIGVSLYSKHSLNSLRVLIYEKYLDNSEQRIRCVNMLGTGGKLFKACVYIRNRLQEILNKKDKACIWHSL